MKNISDMNATELLDEYNRLGNNFTKDRMVRRRFLELKSESKITPEELDAFAKYDEFAFVLAIDEIFKDAGQEQKQVGDVINTVWKYMTRGGKPVDGLYIPSLLEEINYIAIPNNYIESLKASYDPENNMKLRKSLNSANIEGSINSIINSGLEASYLEGLMESVGEFIDSIKTLLGLEVEERTKVTIKPSVLGKVREGLRDTKHADNLEIKATTLKDTAKDWKTRVTEGTSKGVQER